MTAAPEPMVASAAPDPGPSSAAADPGPPVAEVAGDASASATPPAEAADAPAETRLPAPASGATASASSDAAAAPVTAPPITAPRGRRRLGLALGAALLPVLLAGTVAAVLVAWDHGYEGRVLPGVRVGPVDVSGLDRAAAAAAIDAAFPYGGGRLVLAAPDGPIAIGDAAIGRRLDTDALVDEAMASGRAGDPLARALAQVRQALEGTVIAPRVVVDRERLAAAVSDATTRLARKPVDATIAMTPAGPAITAARPGRRADPAPIVDAAAAALTAPDAPDEVRVPVRVAAIAPAIDDETVAIARIRADRLVRDVVLTYRDRTWTIQAATVRGWVRFAVAPDGTVAPVVDTTTVAASLRKPAKVILRRPVEPVFLRARSGRPVGVVAGRDGRSIDTVATVARIVAELERRADGATTTAIAVKAMKLAPKTSTAEAQRTAPLMTKLGSWTTWFPVSERNFYGANIWRPAQLIDGTVLAPGEWFDWWRAIWPVTRARGFGPGGVIRSDHTDPTGALGGGMCSSSTTLFNAALRAGLQMGARANHKYYITRYPLGLDATVSIMGGARQTMSFRNDTRHPIVIRAFRIRGSGGRGLVRYEIWGVDDGRRVAIGRPSVSNVSVATWKTVTVTTLPHGVRHVTEVPSNGMTVRVTRVVRNAAGRVIHSETYTTRYVRWNGRVEVGA